MSRRLEGRSIQTGHDENVIECAPESLFKGIIGCFGLFVSFVMVSALAITAAGVFWTAQSMYHLTTGENEIMISIRKL